MQYTHKYVFYITLCIHNITHVYPFYIALYTRVHPFYIALYTHIYTSFLHFTLYTHIYTSFLHDTLYTHIHSFYMTLYVRIYILFTLQFVSVKIPTILATAAICYYIPKATARKLLDSRAVVCHALKIVELASTNPLPT